MCGGYSLVRMTMRIGDLSKRRAAGESLPLALPGQRLLPGLFQRIERRPDDPVAAASSDPQPWLLAGLAQKRQRHVSGKVLLQLRRLPRPRLQHEARRRFAEEQHIVGEIA